MTQYQLTLTPTAADFIDQQLATGQFASPSDVVSRALEQALENQSRQRLRELLCEGLESGPAIPITPEYMSQRRMELLAKLPPGISE